MPFVPAALAGGGLTAEWIGLTLALGSACRLVAGVASARVAEAVGIRNVLMFGSVLAGLTLPGLGLASGLALLLLLHILYSVAVAPVAPLSDAAALEAIRREPFDYGRIRAWGSLAFIAGACLAGPAVDHWGPVAALCLSGGALLATATTVIGMQSEPIAIRPRGESFWSPLRLPVFRTSLLCSALIQSSHAVYYGFSALYWESAGLSPTLIGLLWAWGVAAEVLLFWFGGPMALRIGPRGLALAAGAAGVLRWTITAATLDMALLFVVQTLHAATFGAMHLAAMRSLAILPSSIGARAQSLHAALGVGLASTLMMLAAGPLYAAWKGEAFLIMALLCLAGMGVAFRLPGRSAK